MPSLRMKSMFFVSIVILFAACRLFGATASKELSEIEREICASDASIAAAQARLTDRCSLSDYAPLTTGGGGRNLDESPSDCAGRARDCGLARAAGSLPD